MTLILKSPAKVNLTLDILDPDTASEYHKIKTIFQEIDLADEIELESDDNNISFDCTFGDLDSSGFDYNKNTLLDTAKLLKREYSVDKGVNIRLKKNIPLRSGLGGGASNAATVLKGLNSLWDLNLSVEQLSLFAPGLGMDTAFFLHGWTALGEHFGEKITPLPNLGKYYFVLVMSGVSISTLYAYDQIKQFKHGTSVDLTKKLVDKIKLNEFDFTLLHNDFDSFALQNYSEIKSAFKELSELAALKVHLCGSGGAVYGIFQCEDDSNFAVSQLKSRFPWVVASSSVSGF